MIPKTFVVGVLYSENRFLAEKRGDQEDHFAGNILFPGGHIEEGETEKEALFREMKEELGIKIKQYHFLGDFYYEDGCVSKVFVISKWDGIPQALEASDVIWIKDESELSNEFDRKIIKKIKSIRF